MEKNEFKKFFEKLQKNHVLLSNKLNKLTPKNFTKIIPYQDKSWGLIIKNNEDVELSVNKENNYKKPEYNLLTIVAEFKSNYANNKIIKSSKLYGRSVTNTGYKTQQVIEKTLNAQVYFNEKSAVVVKNIRLKKLTANKLIFEINSFEKKLKIVKEELPKIIKDITNQPKRYGLPLKDKVSEELISTANKIIKKVSKNNLFNNKNNKLTEKIKEVILENETVKLNISLKNTVFGEKITLFYYIKINPLNYDYYSCVDKEYPSTNTILGGKILGIVNELYEASLDYGPNEVKAFCLIEINADQESKAIKKLNRFENSINKIEKLVNFLIKDIKKNPKKYEHIIAYG
jgi:HEPN domain-containing protein